MKHLKLKLVKIENILCIKILYFYDSNIENWSWKCNDTHMIISANKDRHTEFGWNYIYINNVNPYKDNVVCRYFRHESDVDILIERIKITVRQFNEIFKDEQEDQNKSDYKAFEIE